MINNYFDYDYKQSHIVYTHQHHHNHIHLGDISSALDTDFILQSNILTVVTAASGMEHVTVPDGVRHVVYALLDMKSENIARFFSQFYDLMEEELARGSVLVHCAAGISRSSTLVCAYLMRRKGWGFKDAIQFIRKSRPTVLPNLGFERQLKQYQNFLNRQPQSTVERRFGSKTSQERKHLSLPERDRGKVLPEIGLMQKTSIKAKVFDMFASQGQKRVPQRSKVLSQQGHKQDSQFNGTKRMSFKGRKTKALPQRMNLMPILSGGEMPMLGGLKVSMPVQKLRDVMTRRLNMQNKKIATTERQLRTKQLHKMAHY